VPPRSPLPEAPPPRAPLRTRLVAPVRLCCIWGMLGAARELPLRSGTRLLRAWRPLCWSACWLATAACWAGTVVVGGAPALLPDAAPAVVAEPCWEPLPSSDLPESDLEASVLAESAFPESA
jgi:hypothetical protein